ncbi:hypothetical protein NKZ03_25970 [Sinorhizobium meliloti]|uniref:hypothetical protein n=1 Tax=Rhizobium meliloti TaxID=382 RepID=UPI003D6594B1
MMQKIEAVARAIAEARGRKPDDLIETWPGADPGAPEQALVGLPSWKMFEAEAKVFIAAQRALDAAE